MHDVFISYSSKDEALANKICSHLESADIKCWMAPRDIAAGSDYTAAIPGAIAECGCFLLVLTRNAQTSHWVHNEVIDALSKGKKIIPLIAEKFELAENFEFLLRGAHREDGSENWDAAIDRVVVSVKNIPVIPEQTSESREHQKLTCPRCGSVQLNERPAWIGSPKQLKDRFPVLAVIAAVLALWGCTTFEGIELTGDFFVTFLVMEYLFVLAVLIVGILLWLLIKYICALVLQKSGRQYFRLKCATCGKKFRKIVKIDSVEHEKAA